MNFIQLCKAGQAHPSDIDDYIHMWHTLDEDGVPLHEYLGMTGEQYSRWLQSAREIYKIVTEN